MPLTFHACNFDQHLFVEHRRTPQHGACNQQLVLACEVAEQDFGSVGERGELPGQIGARGRSGVRHKIDQDAIKQIDMIGSKSRSSLHQQFGNPADRVCKAFRIAVPDDFIKTRDEGSCD